MPQAKDILSFVPQAPSSFVSPFSDRPPTSFYSSITIQGRGGNCLTCGVLDLTLNELNDFIQQISDISPNESAAGSSGPSDPQFSQSLPNPPPADANTPSQPPPPPPDPPVEPTPPPTPTPPSPTPSDLPTINPSCGGMPTGSNVFTISRGQYLEYYRGGRWTINYNGHYHESWDGPPDAAAIYDATLIGSDFVDYANSCTTSKSFDMPGTNATTVTNPPGPPVQITYYTDSCAFTMELGAAGGLYYVKFHLAANYMGNSGCTIYPPTISSIVNGQALTYCGTWTPGGIGNVGYSNTTNIQITATFTPR